MAFSAIDQLIAKGTPSPITSALQGFQQGAQIIPALRLAQLAPALRQAQIQEALAKAQLPFGGQSLTGPAEMALSELRFQQRYGNDPAKMQTLQYYKDFQERSQNLRSFQTMTKDERANWFAQARGMGYSQDEAIKAFANGYTLNTLHLWKQQKINPLSISHSAENFSSDKLPSTIHEVNYHGRPMSPDEIRPIYPLTSGAVTAQQKAVTASAGMDYLSKSITNGLNYGGWYSPFTRPWFWDAQSNNPERQQKAVEYYAAHSLKPELALYRMRIQQGQASARAMKALEPTIIGDISPQLQYLPANIQKRIQNRVREVLEESTRQSSLQALGKTPTLPPEERPTQTVTQQVTGRIRVQSPEGKIGTISAKNLQAALKEGYKRIS